MSHESCVIYMIPGSKGLNPHELAHRWGRIVGVLSTEQFAGIKVGDICPGIIYVVKENAALSDDV
jgi:hypothetical protein